MNIIQNFIARLFALQSPKWLLSYRCPTSQTNQHIQHPFVLRCCGFWTIVSGFTLDKYTCYMLTIWHYTSTIIWVNVHLWEPLSRTLKCAIHTHITILGWYLKFSTVVIQTWSVHSKFSCSAKVIQGSQIHRKIALHSQSSIGFTLWAPKVYLGRADASSSFLNSSEPWPVVVVQKIWCKNQC